MDLISDENFSLFCFGTVGASVNLIIRPHHCRMINVSALPGGTVFRRGPVTIMLHRLIICQDFRFASHRHVTGVQWIHHELGATRQ